MQILAIKLKNIKSHRDTELTFSPGINVLSGPNGVGKSTIFEAIGYALFGVDAQTFVSNVERFISIGEKKGEVAVTFQCDDGETYRATRTVATPSKWLLARQQGCGFEVEELRTCYRGYCDLAVCRPSLISRESLQQSP